MKPSASRLRFRQGCVLPPPIPTRGSGDLSDQPGAARMGQLLRGGKLRIVSIPTPRELRECPCHPEIERVMHEQIREDRADNTTLRGTTRTLHPRPVLEPHRRLQPTYDVQQRTFAYHLFPDRP